MLANEVVDVAKKIGLFYLEKNLNDYDKTYDELLSLQITNLDVIDNWVVITTARPGQLMGKRGENIDGLSLHLSPLKINIVEESNSFIDVMMPVDPDTDYDEYYAQDLNEMLKNIQQTPNQ
jgi:hypothetical protein